MPHSDNVNLFYFILAFSLYCVFRLYNMNWNGREEQIMLLACIFLLSRQNEIQIDMLDKVLNIIPLDIVCLMETCVFPKDRALVNVQKLAFCVQSNAEENIFAT